MGNPLTKSNEGFRPRQDGQMIDVTVRLWLPGTPGEISTLRAAAIACDTLAVYGRMPRNVETITREVVDTEPSV